jgi:hypothetical protein
MSPAEIERQANLLVDAIHARYRVASRDEPHALDDDEVIARVSDTPVDDDVYMRACCLLEPTEGVVPRWVPRTRKLSLDAEDDIETLAKIIAHKAIKGYTPVPYYIFKEVEQNNSMFESEELVADILDSDDFTSEVIFDRVFNAACTIIDEWNESNGGLWWDIEPEPPIEQERNNPIEDNESL